ncbi:hypothetical protein FCZ27_00320 [Escherichia coli]|nr:hypothetical protein [Escherichia coli]HEK8389294.1 hypothetical protein [Escherichia coli]
MSKGVSTDLVIKAHDLGFKINEIDNRVTGMFHVVISSRQNERELFSMFLMSGGLFHWEKNINLPKSVTDKITIARFDGERAFASLLEVVSEEITNVH